MITEGKPQFFIEHFSIKEMNKKGASLYSSSFFDISRNSDSDVRHLAAGIEKVKKTS